MVSPLRAGSVLAGRYEIESVIAEGGMATLLKARHTGLDELVAIKVLRTELMARRDIVMRFLREAKAAVKLKGEHVARVLDVGRLPDHTPYIVMEYLEGADLNAIVKHHGALEPAVAVDLILEACEAIAEAHSLGIIHRDIKSSNFFVAQPEGHEPMLKVLDFGIATAPEGTSDLTSTQSVIGTPAYMAPEQMRASREVDARSDIWSIGVVLYELLEGKRPFPSEVYSELCLQIGMDAPAPFSNPAVPDRLRGVVLRCLEKPVANRFQSVAELAGELMHFASDHVKARASFDQCARLLARRSRMMPAVAPPADDEWDDDRPTNLVAPSRRTPRAIVVPAATGDSKPIVTVPTVLGRPTPIPTAQPRTPTSINESRGEAYENIRLRPRFGALAVLLLALIGVAGAALYVTRYAPEANRAASQVQQPITAPAPPPPVKKVEPPPPPPPPTIKPTVKAPTVKPKPGSGSAPPATGSAAKPKP